MTDAGVEHATGAVERWNRVFEAVSAEPRRQLVVSLLDASADRSVSLPESAINPNVPPDPTTLRYELVHCHLPLLADMGFIQWRTEPFVASRGERFGEVAAVFEALHDDADALPDSLVVGCQRLERERRS